MHAIHTENGNREKKGNLKIYNRICVFNHIVMVFKYNL